MESRHRPKGQGRNQENRLNEATFRRSPAGPSLPRIIRRDGDSPEIFSLQGKQMFSSQVTLPSVDAGEEAVAGRRTAMDNTSESEVPTKVETRSPEAAPLHAERAEPAGPVSSNPGPIPSGIPQIDERLGGLEPGGVYLVAGSPGPGKLVTALHFLHAGVDRGEKVVMFTTVEDDGIPEIARGWGMNLDNAWRDGSLLLFGFRDDFELRVLRSAEPLEVFEQLQELIPADVSRVAFDPGSMFLRNGSRNQLAKAFMDWGRRHPAIVMATLAVDSGEGLPSSTEWLVQATDAVIQIDRRPDGLHQVRVNRALMGSLGEDDPITLQLTPGKGLVPTGPQPARRRADRPSGAAERLLLLSLDKTQGGELEGWVGGAFQTEIVREPLEAVTLLQEDSGFGGILVHATRQEIGSAVRACRAIRPLTGAAVVVASDDALRSTDRVALLDSGADDCLSGGVDFRELEARLRQAVSVGGKPPSEMAKRKGTEEITGGMVSLAEFRSEVETRAGIQAAAIFSVVRLTSGILDIQALEQALTDTVRAPEGDLVTRMQDSCLVLLQGARKNAAHAFLARFEEILQKRLGTGPKLKASVLASPVSMEGFENMLASSGGNPGGADDAQA